MEEPALKFSIPIQNLRKWYSEISGVQKVNFKEDKDIFRAFNMWLSSGPTGQNVEALPEGVNWESSLLDVSVSGSGADFHALSRRIEAFANSD
jgi:hypothetical protein